MIKPTFEVNRSARGDDEIVIFTTRAGASAIADVILTSDGDEYENTKELGIQISELLYQIRKQGEVS